VRMWELPHTNQNFIQKEMGFVVARKHALKLRQFTFVLLAVALLATILSAVIAPWFASVAAVAAVAAAVVERWLFFAEAEHVVNLYYGRASV
jgi:sulfite dehydrogenase (quinone) subunit SoeC